MRFVPSEIPGVLLVEPQVFGDSRGFFMETWHAAKFAAAGLDCNFVQDNHSKSVQGTLRGLHYQIKKPQGKLVRVISGEVFDVAVDLRKSSPFFGRWVGEILSAENKKMLWVPPGFGHGFYVLSPEAEFVYKCTEFYAPEDECCIRWDDSELAIAWPLLGQPPLLSPKDLAGVSLTKAELYP
ncbi:MAG: dTDP-4-dehydrorhamnose 3,5-epimerase [Deltaproteobacteria bacterium]|uniref:dTDP-4-dehydrorhamnose 3,5-epimerase n=1 Tax=Hydrosulfovibrio ferrireducens TaxID=2934181 RepID=UPI0011F94063|nr:MAG: dTDP-4-dehydrorhamnose 3,5-epimerase [Deltaproteobacteria bacterium]